MDKEREQTAFRAEGRSGWGPRPRETSRLEISTGTKAGAASHFMLKVLHFTPIAMGSHRQVLRKRVT